MADIIKEALNAPVANILIIAGVAFIGIAIAGNISGKINPGTTGRVVGGVVGAVLIIAGLGWHFVPGTSEESDEGTRQDKPPTVSFTVEPARPSPSPEGTPPRPVPTSTPTAQALSIQRRGETGCLNGISCALNYNVGPVSVLAMTLRVDFSVILTGPANAVYDWQNDVGANAEVKNKTGAPSVYLTLANSSQIYSEIKGAGGLAMRDEMLRSGTSYRGSWEFEIRHPPGTLLSLHYPDFASNPIPIVVPDTR